MAYFLNALGIRHFGAPKPLAEYAVWEDQEELRDNAVLSHVSGSIDSGDFCIYLALEDDFFAACLVEGDELLRVDPNIWYNAEQDVIDWMGGSDYENGFVYSTAQNIYYSPGSWASYPIHPELFAGERRTQIAGTCLLKGHALAYYESRDEKAKMLNLEKGAELELCFSPRMVLQRTPDLVLCYADWSSNLCVWDYRTREIDLSIRCEGLETRQFDVCGNQFVYVSEEGSEYNVAIKSSDFRFPACAMESAQTFVNGRKGTCRCGQCDFKHQANSIPGNLCLTRDGRVYFYLKRRTDRDGETTKKNWMCSVDTKRAGKMVKSVATIGERSFAHVCADANRHQRMKLQFDSEFQGLAVFLSQFGTVALRCQKRANAELFCFRSFLRPN